MEHAMHGEDDLLPLSALQHLLFCERQCALIHIERAWAENRLTAQGRVLHERVHEQDAESRGDVRIARGLRIRSLRLGLIGQADVVEFRRAPEDAWQPYPVEYKRGRSKADDCDRVQLCAQAMCLEEMLSATVPEGALFYGQPRRREVVTFTPDLRGRVEASAVRLRELIEGARTPPARYERKCESCSLLGLCRPQLPRAAGGVAAFLAKACEGP